MRRPVRMQVSTSTSRRRLPWCMIGSAEATSGRPSASRQPRGAGDAGLVLRRRSAGSATRWAWGCARAKARAWGSHAAQVAARGQVQEQREVGDAARELAVGEVGEAKVALSLGGAPGAEGEQAAEPGPAGAVAGKGGDLEALGEAEPAGGNEARHGRAGAGELAQGVEGADQAGDGVAVGEGEGGQAELGRADRMLVRVAAAGQEGEVRGDRELGEGHRPFVLAQARRPGWRAGDNRPAMPPARVSEPGRVC